MILAIDSLVDFFCMKKDSKFLLMTEDIGGDVEGLRLDRLEVCGFLGFEWESV